MPKIKPVNISRDFPALLIVLFAFASSALGQTSAVLSPDNTALSLSYASALNTSMAREIETTDLDLAAAVLRAQELENPYNQTVTEARALGAGIGCGYFVLVRADTLRRASLENNMYFEAYAAVFLVSSKTGGLIYWGIYNREADTPEKAESNLVESADETGAEIAKRIATDLKNGNIPTVEEAIVEELGEMDSGARTPMPYRRIKPDYPQLARHYQIEATVDIEVTIDSTGVVKDTRIVRWAGFGLDESVDKTVRLMQWRPADGKGKSFAMRVLLRYNFKDLENPVD